MNNETTKKVTDVSLPDKGFIYKNASATRSYEYDHNGNLKSDLNKGITNIEYNFLNLPQVITFTNDSIGRPRRLEFIYDASGAKLRKTRFLNNIAEETIHYVNGVEYKNNVLERVAHTEGGVIRVVDPVTSAVSYQQEYILRDHLGNTRVTFSDANNDSLVTSADIKQINSYYPFGLNMEGNWNGAAGSNKYGFNGKEWNDDFGLGWNDYGARFYDPSVVNFTTIDPHCEHYLDFNPYNYVLNNPINMIDPNGKDAIFTLQRDKNGEIIGINISSTIYIKGKGASQERANQLNEAAKNILINGKASNIQVSFNVTYKYDENKKQSQLVEGENILQFTDKKGETHVVGGYRESGKKEVGDYGSIFKEDWKDNKAIMHETLHLLGLSDRYDSPDRKTLKTHEGFKDDIMGTAESSKIGYTHYYYYAQFAKSAKGSYLWSPVDQNSKGKLLPYIPNPTTSNKAKKR